MTEVAGGSIDWCRYILYGSYLALRWARPFFTYYINGSLVILKMHLLQEFTKVCFQTQYCFRVGRAFPCSHAEFTSFVWNVDGVKAVPKHACLNM